MPGRSGQPPGPPGHLRMSCSNSESDSSTVTGKSQSTKATNHLGRATNGSEEPKMLFSVLASIDGNTNFDITDIYSCNGPPCSSWTFPTETYLPASTFQHSHDPPQQVTWQPVDWRTVHEDCSAYGQMMGTCTPEPWPATWIA